MVTFAPIIPHFLQEAENILRSKSYDISVTTM